MELTIPVVKIAVVGILTFGAAVMLKPIALVIRDYLIWQGISWYMSRSRFDFRARRYANWKACYIEHLKQGQLHAHFANNKFYLGDNVITFDQFQYENERREQLSDNIFKSSVRIDKEVSIIDSLLRHFDQEGSNPALEIIQHHEHREFARRGLGQEE